MGNLGKEASQRTPTKVGGLDFRVSSIQGVSSLSLDSIKVFKETLETGS